MPRICTFCEFPTGFFWLSCNNKHQDKTLAMLEESMGPHGVELSLSKARGH